ncbi:MAG: ATP-dependent endonuclease [Gemmatimonadales bacterium]|nr:ATP-dependent endonuclease [Gemmatimonadales bacterium]
MRLHQIRIEGYKRIQTATIVCGDATFLIGANNSGKTSVLAAIGYLLSGNKRIPETEYTCVHDELTGERKTVNSRIVLEGEFRNVPAAAKAWRGFKGRTFDYDPGETGESGICLTYRKTYDLGKDVVIEIKSRTRSLAPAYEDIKAPQDLIDRGLPAEQVTELFPDLTKKFTVASRVALEAIDDIWLLGSDEEWFQNPGGIPGVVLARLPRYLFIPAGDSSHEIAGSGVLSRTLNELFEDVRGASHNYREAQKLLDELAKELDPTDSTSEFGKMLLELNGVIASIFPESTIHAKADLSDPNKSLRPSFTIELSSNVRTPVDHQGTGMVRAAVFGVLRYRQRWLARREDTESIRPLIIGFEEPEIYLHPSAANQMRDTIYGLSGSDSQIIATTHSPFLIDLSRKPRQVLNRFALAGGAVEVKAFSVTEAFANLHDDDKDYVKMLMRIDDYVARVFFARRVIIVEGDTEDIVIRESLSRLELQARQHVLAGTETIKARGKASIIGIVRYLKAMGIHPYVIHDLDSTVPKAAQFNPKIQSEAGPGMVFPLADCIEDVLGYSAPSSEKPLKAYLATRQWGPSWTDIPEEWRVVMTKAFGLPA